MSFPANWIKFRQQEFVKILSIFQYPWSCQSQCFYRANKFCCKLKWQNIDSSCNYLQVSYEKFLIRFEVRDIHRFKYFILHESIVKMLSYFYINKSSYGWFWLNYLLLQLKTSFATHMPFIGSCQHDIWIRMLAFDKELMFVLRIMINS